MTEMICEWQAVLHEPTSAAVPEPQALLFHPVDIDERILMRDTRTVIHIGLVGQAGTEEFKLA